MTTTTTKVWKSQSLCLYFIVHSCSRVLARQRFFLQMNDPRDHDSLAVGAVGGDQSSAL